MASRDLSTSLNGIPKSLRSCGLLKASCRGKEKTLEKSSDGRTSDHSQAKSMGKKEATMVKDTGKRMVACEPKAKHTWKRTVQKASQRKSGSSVSKAMRKREQSGAQRIFKNL